MIRTGKLRLTGPVRVYEATPIRGQSTREAHADARTWLVGKGGDAESGGELPDDVKSADTPN